MISALRHEQMAKVGSRLRLHPELVGVTFPGPHDQADRAEVLRIVDIFRGKVVDVSPTSYALEITGSESKINAVLDILRPIGIKEIVRTGTIAMARAPKK